MKKICCLILLIIFGMMGCQQEEIDKCILEMENQESLQLVQKMVDVNKQEVQIEAVQTEKINTDTFTWLIDTHPARPKPSTDLLITIGETTPSKNEYAAYIQFLYHKEKEMILAYRVLETNTNQPPFTYLEPYKDIIQICMEKIEAWQDKNPALKKHLNKEKISVELFNEHIHHIRDYDWFEVFGNKDIVITIGDTEIKNDEQAVYLQFICHAKVNSITGVQLMEVKTKEKLKMKMDESYIHYN